MPFKVQQWMDCKDWQRTGLFSKAESELDSNQNIVIILTLTSLHRVSSQLVLVTMNSGRAWRPQLKPSTVLTHNLCIQKNNYKMYDDL